MEAVACVVGRSCFLVNWGLPSFTQYQNSQLTAEEQSFMIMNLKLCSLCLMTIKIVKEDRDLPEEVWNLRKERFSLIIAKVAWWS